MMMRKARVFFKGNGYITSGQAFGHAEDKTTQNGPGQALQPTQDGGCKTLKKWLQHEKGVEEKRWRQK